MVSHDLKSPLATIAMTTGLLLEHLAGRGGDRAAIERIGRSADHMGRLIRDLLDLAKLEGGHLSIEPQPHEVAGLMNDVVELLRAEAAAKACAWTSGWPRGGAGALRPGAHRAGDGQPDRQRHQVHPQRGEIALAAERAGGEVVLSVRDTGPGIPEDQRAHVFDRFWQTTHARQGTGLGLSIAKGLVELHGGRIWVASQPGAGSTFSFTLPAE